MACLPLLAAGAGMAQAQNYPAKPIRLIVPFPPGGANDILARILGQKLTETLGENVLVDNRAGASGIIGTELVAKAVPDGYTILMTPNTIAIQPSLYEKLPFDAAKDLVPVSLVAIVPNILITTRTLPVTSVKELIAIARARPLELSYGSNGAGSTLHLAAELFARDARVKMLHVPYKGAAPALLDLIGGQIAVVFDQISTSIPYINAGKLRALGVTASRRSPVYPDLPTIAEAGLPGYDTVTWNGIGALAGTPREALARLHSEIARVLQAPDVKARYLQQGIELAPSASLEEFAEFLRTDVAKMARVAREAGIKAE